MGRKSNWDILRKKAPEDTTKYRDVYEDQQLERSEIEDLETMTSRTIVAVIASILVAILGYILASGLMFVVSKSSDVNTGTGQQTTVSSSSVAGADGSGQLSSDTGDGTAGTAGAVDMGPNPFEGFGEMSKATDIAKQWFTLQGDGNYQLKDEYNYWGDYNHYPAYQLRDVIGNCYTRYANGDILSEDERQEIADQNNVMTDDNPFAGYADINKATDIAKKWFNPVGDGTYRFKPEYNFWNDNNAYMATDLRELIASKYSQYEADYGAGSTGSDSSSGSVQSSSENGENGTDGVQETTVKKSPAKGSFAYCMSPLRFWNVLVGLLSGLLAYSILYAVLKRNLDAQNMLNDTKDINQYKNDQHIALPEEVQRKFDWFPDAGAHCGVQVSSMISHVMLSNKGINSIQFAKRYKENVLDEDGDIDVYAGEVMRDPNDDKKVLTETVPMFDEKFAEDIYETSGVLEKSIRKYYDPTKIPYNGDGRDRTKQGGKWNNVAELINNTWHIPDYEPQRPAGAYLVDTEPVNTLVLAITRAGKGQTVIEPTIDMWTREDRPGNMVINDPKGELLLKFYVRGTVRGFEIVQFNLINPIKTDIYNPMEMAAAAAREGDITKCATYVENIATVFFPLDGGEDPVWPNAANNAFKRAAYGLIDYYMEEEKELRLYAERTKMDPSLLELKLDELWGHVTLYNCYQLFVQLSSKKMPNPAIEWKKRANNHEFDNMSDEEYQEALDDINKKTPLWENRPEADLLTLYFNATAKLPSNQLRTLVQNTNNALRSMSGAEKMMASVYGIAITAMVTTGHSVKSAA